MNTPHSDIFAGFFDNLVERVISAIGQQSIRSIFIGGSGATGEFCFCRVQERLEIYSDVDLYVVIKNHNQLDKTREAVRRAIGDFPLSGEGYVFFRRPDVGVYSFEDLMAQPSRPGTVELAEKHKVLFGDPDLPAQTAEHIDREIQPEEGLYLIENRLHELADYWDKNANAPDAASAARFMTFLACKTCADVVTAALIARGRFETSRRERKLAFDALAEDGGLEGCFDAGQFELIDGCYAALENLPEPIESPFGSVSETADMAVSLALHEWKRIAADCLGEVSGDWTSMILKRCNIGEYIPNYRQFLVINGRFGGGRVASMAAGIHLMRYSPVNTLRLSALVDYLRRSAAFSTGLDNLFSSVEPFLERLTRACGFSQGSLAERSRRMYQAIQ